jgi:glutaredoxin-related protein
VALLIQAGHESLIKSLFVMNQDPTLGYQDRINSGLHQVRLYLNGEQKVISIDDLVPCQKGSSQLPLCTLSATEGELWVPLLEKACAKVFQGYDRLMQLHTLDIIKALTTVPQVFLDHDRVGSEDIWKNIHANSSLSGSLNSLMFASNGTETGKDKGHTLGATLFAI